MRGFHLAFALAMIGLVISSGCLRENVQEIFERPDARVGDAQLTSPGAAEAGIFVTGLLTDKDVYHSAEVMNLSVTLYSTSDLEGVQVTAKGIKNKLNIQRTVNLSKGENNVRFAYRLPRCNVCGGLSAGRYSVECEVTHGNTTMRNTTYVELEQ